MTARRRDSSDVELVLTLGDAQPSLESRVVAGEPAALDQFAREQAPRVLRLLHRILGPRDDLHDLVQIVFVEFLRSLPRFRGHSRLSTFVGGITVRVAQRTLRPSAWTRRRHPEYVEPAASTSDVDSQVAARDQLRRLHVVLSKIKPKKRIAYTLWVLEGLAPAEIAELTNASLSATRSRIFHAQKELRAMAEQDPWLGELLGADDE